MSSASMSAFQKLWGSQEFRFLLVGATNTIAGYIFFATLLTILGETHYVVSGVLSHILGASLSFGLNRRYVFTSGGQVFPNFLRFQLTYVVAIAVNISLLVGLVEGLGWAVLFAQAVCLVFVPFLSYFGHKYFSFRS